MKDRPIYLISVAAQLAGMHPQTLREYDRLGLVSPTRTPGRGRRYSVLDVERLRRVQQLSQEEGINLAGIKRILDLEERLDQAETELDRLRLIAEPGRHRVFAAGPLGEVVVTKTRALRMPAHSRAVVLWRP